MDKGSSISTNVIWRLAERICAQGVSFIVSVILARLIAPDVYGTVALITVITNIMNVFIQSGLSTALIQKQSSDKLDFSTVFTFNMAMALVLYALMYLSAPLIADFYNNQDMIWPVRILSFSLILGGINGVQQAYVSKKMQFHLFFNATIIGTICSAVVGIFMAYKGYGVWALVGQILTNQMIDTFILWLMLDWHPGFRFSVDRFKPLYSFGWKVFVSNLIDTTYKNLRSLLIGKVYTEADLAYYNRGNRLPELVITNINSSIQSVFFPAYSATANDSGKLRSLVKKSISTSTYLIFPCMIGLAVTSRTLIILLYTEKWLFAVPYMWIGCYSYLFWPLHTANLQVIQAMGRSDITLKIEVIKKTVTIISLIISIRFGVFAVAACAIPLAVFSLVVNAVPNKKLLDYSLVEQFKDFWPALWMSGIMGGIVYCVGLINIPRLPLLALQILTGGGVYLLLSVITKNESFAYVKNRALSVIKGRKAKRINYK